MNKRFPALLLVIVMLMMLLCGCGNKTTDDFYAFCDEIRELEDVQFSLTVPYHGAKLTAEGFVSRTGQSADVKIGLSGTRNADGALTEVVINGRQVWLNVAQLSQRTLAFDLSESRRVDIEELDQDQLSDWVCYQWEGDLWDGIPEWEELLSRLWQDLRDDLNGHIQAGETGYTLTLNGNGLNQTTEHVLTALEQQYSTYRSAFVRTMETETGIVMASQLDPGILFDDYWSQTVGLERDEGEGYSSMVLSAEHVGNDYFFSLSADENLLLDLQLTPIASRSAEQPEQSMEFREYFDDLFYLISFSRTYIGDALDGIIPDEELIQEEPEELFVDPLVKQAVSGYSDIATVQMMTPGGNVQNVPILTGYDSCQTSMGSGEGIIETDFSISNAHWTQQVSAVPASGLLSDAVSQISERYYDAYINVTGCLLVQDLSEVKRSSDGQTVIQGFSYRENDYAQTEARLIVVTSNSDGAEYISTELYLNLSELTQSEQIMVAHLLDYMGVESPILLEP